MSKPTEPIKPTKPTKTRKEKIENIDEQIAQLQNRKKTELQKFKSEERKATTHRYCKRHAILEKAMPILKELTDEEFALFVKIGINTTYGNSKANEIFAKRKTKPPAEKTNSATATITAPATENANSTTATEATRTTEITKSQEANSTSGGENSPNAGSPGA